MMDLEKAYNKIDNLCLMSYNSATLINMDIAKGRMPEKIDFFKGYNETHDEDFCKDTDEMLDALETIKELVDLQKEIGCSLEVLYKIKKSKQIYVDTYIVQTMAGANTSMVPGIYNVREIDILNSQIKCVAQFSSSYLEFYVPIREYKTDWFLKKDKSE